MSDGAALLNEKLLGFYQEIIGRMGANSSAAKGWAITVATGVVGFAVKDGPPGLSYVAIVPIVLFFALDGYYLAAERGFRSKYNEAAEASTQLTLKIEGGVVTVAGWLRALRQPVTWGVYLMLAAIAVAVGLAWLGSGT